MKIKIFSKKKTLIQDSEPNKWNSEDIWIIKFGLFQQARILLQHILGIFTFFDYREKFPVSLYTHTFQVSVQLIN